MPYKDGAPTLGEQLDEDAARGFYTKDILKEARQDRDEIKRLRKALQEIEDGYGPNHGSKFCRDKAREALTSQE